MFEGLFGGAAPILRAVNEGANGILEAVSPGSTHAKTTTGNLVGNKGVTDDVITGLETGDISGAVLAVYGDIIGPGGVVNNLGEGEGLGIEGLLVNTLGTADGFLGVADGLLDGAIGGGDTLFN